MPVSGRRRFPSCPARAPWHARYPVSCISYNDPELIIVAGGGVEAGDLRFDPMREALSEGQFNSLGDGTKLVVESSGDVIWARGAACVVLSEFFRSPLQSGGPSALTLAETG